MTGSVTFTASKADYIAAMRVHYLRQLRSRKFVVRMVTLGLGLWVAVTLVGFSLDGELISSAVIGLLSVMSGFAGLGIVIGGNALLLPRRAGRLYDQQKSIHRPSQFSWDETGTRWISETGDVRSPWTDYHRWTATKDVILLYLNDQFMHFVPRHVLGTACDDLIETVREAGVLPR
ncbi:MAG: hypothetical protein BVN32_09175 [Proteobacteria bacterium ST_bin14]|nr:MAG: hypothetical protein BVN32_09175 [Proteobacteria bacterium ST_bin14]